MKIKSRLSLVFLTSSVIYYSTVAVTDTLMSPPITLSYARAAVAEMPIRQFATNDGRYLARGYQVVSMKRPNVFVVEVEIIPLPKHGN